MYYGGENPYASFRKPEEIFLLYDDFKTFDTNKWTVVRGNVTVTPYGLEVRGVGEKLGTNTGGGIVKSNKVFSGNIRIFALVNTTYLSNNNRGGITIYIADDYYYTIKRRQDGTTTNWKIQYIYESGNIVRKNINIASTRNPEWIGLEWSNYVVPFYLENGYLITYFDYGDSAHYITGSVALDVEANPGYTGIGVFQTVFVAPFVTPEPIVHIPSYDLYEVIYERGGDRYVRIYGDLVTTTWNKMYMVMPDRNIYSYGSKMNVTARLVNEYGLPLSGITVTIWVGNMRGETIDSSTVITDENGYASTLLTISYNQDENLVVQAESEHGVKTTTVKLTDINITYTVNPLISGIGQPVTLIVNAYYTIDSTPVIGSINIDNNNYSLGQPITFTQNRVGEKSIVIYNVTDIYGNHKNIGKTITVVFDDPLITCIGFDYTGDIVVEAVSMFNSSRLIVSQLTNVPEENKVIISTRHNGYNLNNKTWIVYFVVYGDYPIRVTTSNNKTIHYVYANPEIKKIEISVEGPTTLYVYTGVLGSPKRVLKDGAEWVGWRFNNTSNFVIIDVPGSVITLDFSPPEPPSGGGGGGGGLYVPPLPGYSDVEEEPQVDWEKMKFGLTIIILSIISVAIASNMSKNKKLSSQWEKELSKKIRVKIKWKPKKKWWE